MSEFVTPGGPSEDPFGERAVDVENLNEHNTSEIPDDPNAPLNLADKPIAEHPHILSPLVRGWFAVVAILGALMTNIDDVIRGIPADSPLLPMILIPLGILLAIFVLTIAIGFINWRFTWFIIDDQMIEIRYTFIVKKLDRIAFSKVQSIDVEQPLVARLLGLASLKIDVGAGGSDHRIAYLKRDRAAHLRDFLMNRAAGVSTTIASESQMAKPGVLIDLADTDEVIVKPPMGLILASLMLTWPAVWSILIIVAALIAVAILTQNLGAPLMVIGVSFFPLLVTTVSVLGAKAHKMFNYTLATNHAGGLRVTSGLFTLNSRSIPLHRVQGIDITQPLLWRPFKWYQVRVEVLGAASTEGGAFEASFLLPVGNHADVLRVLSYVWPQVDYDAIERHPIPSRARWFRWFDAHTYAWGFSDEVLLASGYLFNHRTTLVPHARVQSVGLHEGPLQRLVGLASVHAHTTPGPIELWCRHLDRDVARELAMTQTERMREARAR